MGYRRQFRWHVYDPKTGRLMTATDPQAEFASHSIGQTEKKYFLELDEWYREAMELLVAPSTPGASVIHTSTPTLPRQHELIRDLKGARFFDCTAEVSHFGIVNSSGGSLTIFSRSCRYTLETESQTC
jgi:hypothetical protein